MRPGLAIKKDFGNKKIMILGFAKEGQDNYFGLRKIFPEKRIAIADKKNFKDLTVKTRQILNRDKAIKLFLGKDYLKKIKDYEIVIKTPGINQRDIQPYLKKGTCLTSQTKIFFDYCPGKIVGITGTKGKGTTASLIYQILKTAGQPAHLVGNIGTPVFLKLLRAREQDIYIYELSSHQLQYLKKSPQIAVFLNIYPDHLDYYKNFKDYFSAKQSITLYQGKGDYFIYNREDKNIRALAKKTVAQTIPFSLKDKKKIYKIIKKKDIPLQGDFNLYNIIAAGLTAQLLGANHKDIRKALTSFKPLTHHLEPLGSHQSIIFYNDSFATIPEATIGAIKALGKNLETIILGGSSKGTIDFTELAETIIQSKIKNIILFPTTGQTIWQAVSQKSKKERKPLRAFFVSSMPQAIKIARQHTQKGHICLLSPACASFSIFKNYKERGNLFKRAVQRL